VKYGKYAWSRHTRGQDVVDLPLPRGSRRGGRSLALRLPFAQRLVAFDFVPATHANVMDVLWMAKRIGKPELFKWSSKILSMQSLSPNSFNTTFGSGVRHHCFLTSRTKLHNCFQSYILGYASRYEECAADEYSNTREDRQRKISVLFAQSTADRNIGHGAAMLSANLIESSVELLTTAPWIL